MGNLITQMLEGLTSMELVATLSAFIIAMGTLLRALGEMFLAIGGYGKLADKEDWFDSAGNWFQKASLAIGKVLTWLGIGNKTNK